MINYKFVKSRYSSQFIGIVLDTYEIKCHSPFKYKGIGYKVLVIKDSLGKTPRKRMIRKRNKEWFIEIEPFDISHINKDWL